MRINLITAGVLATMYGFNGSRATATITGEADVEVFANDGKLLFSTVEVVPPAPPAPAPKVPTKLSSMYFTADDLVAAVAAAQPPYPVWCDSDMGPALPGSAATGQPIRYGSQDPATHPNPYIVLMNPEHPYFGQAVATAEAQSAGEVSRVKAASVALTAPASPGAATDPTKVWETAESTTPPLDMMFLIYLIGPGGATSQRLALDYQRWYYTRYPSGQASDYVPGAAHNAQVYTNEQIAAIVAGK